MAPRLQDARYGPSVKKQGMDQWAGGEPVMPALRAAPQLTTRDARSTYRAVA